MREIKTEKPILFNTDMVKSILEGRKTQTRRIIKPQPKENHTYKLGFITGSTDSSRIGSFGWGTNEHGGVISTAKPPYAVGDILWVRETWNHKYLNQGFMYKADNTTWDYPNIEPWWHPSIHMPRSAARIFLKVTNVRVERLQDIDSRGAWNEGVRCKCMHPVPECAGNKSEFIKLWDSIYNNWNDNPWVWVIEFGWCEG